MVMNMQKKGYVPKNQYRDLSMLTTDQYHQEIAAQSIETEENNNQKQ